MAAERPWEANWRIENNLSGGGQGTTYLVSSLSEPNKRGVLKTLVSKNKRSLQARGRMHVEVASLDVLAKQGVKVPQVYEGNTREHADLATELYFIMEYIAGRTLKKEVSERGPLPLEKAVAIAMELCSTVSAAHKQGILHRDLKPDNIVVRDFDNVDLVIVDYGLSFNNADAAGERLTEAGEQFRSRFLALPETNTPGGDRRDKRSDVTAICTILYFCLTGHEPGQLRDANGLPIHRSKGFSVRQAMGSDPRCDQVEFLLDVGLAYEVETRFQDCEELKTWLNRVLEPVDRAGEDPEKVASELGRILRQHDRKTRLAQYGEFAQSIFNQASPYLANRPRNFGPFSVTLGLGGGFAPPNKPVPVGLEPLAGGSEITVALQPHQLYRTISFAMAVKGQRCVLLRSIVAGRQSGGMVHTPRDWEQFLWLDPEQPPGFAFGPLIDQSISSAMRELYEEVQAG